MPDLVEIPIEIVLALIGALVLLLALFVLRRRYLAHGRWAMLLALRERGRWRMGMVRPSQDRIEWFSMRSLGLRPKYVWSRYEFRLGAPHRMEQPIFALTDPVELDCEFDGEQFDAALSRYDYTALRSWSESSPPGALVYSDDE